MYNTYNRRRVVRSGDKSHTIYQCSEKSKCALLFPSIPKGKGYRGLAENVFIPELCISPSWTRDEVESTGITSTPNRSMCTSNIIANLSACEGKVDAVLVMWKIAHDDLKNLQ